MIESGDRMTATSTVWFWVAPRIHNPLGLVHKDRLNVPAGMLPFLQQWRGCTCNMT